MKKTIIALAAVGIGCIGLNAQADRSRHHSLEPFPKQFGNGAVQNNRYYRKARKYYQKYTYYYQYRAQYPDKYRKYYHKYKKYLRKAQRRGSRYAGRRGYGSGSLPSRISPPGEKMFVFSPRHKAWAAYDAEGRRLAGGRANGGADYCADVGRRCRTPVGTFRVRSKGSPGCTSSKFPVGRGGAPMPYCMFFRGGYAIHGSPYISNVNGSHGCIRVTTSAAAWLHSDFIGPGTKVKVLPY